MFVCYFLTFTITKVQGASWQGGQLINPPCSCNFWPPGGLAQPPLLTDWGMGLLKLFTINNVAEKAAWRLKVQITRWATGAPPGAHWKSSVLPKPLLPIGRGLAQKTPPPPSALQASDDKTSLTPSSFSATYTLQQFSSKTCGERQLRGTG